MDNSGERRGVVPVAMAMPVPVPVPNQSGGAGSYAVLQLVGFAHSPTANNNAPPTIIWSPAGSPLPSPRNATSGSPALESPRPQVSEAQPQQQVATTFVQADTSSFKEVVQKLTGASDEKKLPITMPARYAPRSSPAAAPEHSATSKPGFEVGPRKAAFKPQLHERRQNMRRLGISVNPPSPLRVNLNLNGRIISPPEILSPSMLDLPSLVLSPVTPLGGDPFDCPSSTTSSCSLTEEDKAIAEKGFYLHPSPLHTPRGPEPELLPLFPLHSPRDSNSTS